MASIGTLLGMGRSLMNFVPENFEWASRTVRVTYRAGPVPRDASAHPSGVRVAAVRSNARRGTAVAMGTV